MVFGSSGCPPRGEWVRTPLTMRQGGQALAFGLTAPRNATRGLLTALGAHVLKHLLFGERPRDDTGKHYQTDMFVLFYIKHTTIHYYTILHTSYICAKQEI